MKKRFLLISIIVIIVIGSVIGGFFIFTNRCPKGYEKLGDKCGKIVDEQSPNEEYYCEPGEELNRKNNTCSVEETILATREKVCDFEMELIDDDTCFIESNIDVGRYYCPEGELDGKSCIITKISEPQKDRYCSEWMYSVYTEYPSLKQSCRRGGEEEWYRCGKGYTMQGGTCYPIMPVLYKYYCTSGKGKLNKNTNKCEYTTTVAAKYTEECPEGYTRKGDVCHIEEYGKPHEEEVCKYGYDIKCKNEYDWTDCTCTGTKVTHAKFKLTCYQGYELVDDMCLLYEYYEG